MTAAPRKQDIFTSFQVGKYLVSPIVRALGRGQYAASVSIRSGHGSMTHDRVMRLTPTFPCRDTAARFAADHALAWIGTPACSLE